MTVSTSANRDDYTGNDSTATYAYSFRIFSNSDLYVAVRNTTTDVISELTLTTDYTVTDAGEYSGGNIVLTDTGQAWMSASSYLDTGYVLTIRRKMSLLQTADIRNQGPFYPQSHEDVYDKLIFIAQQQQEELDRSMKLPETQDSVDLDPTLPADLAGTASVCIVTDSLGTSLVVGPTTSEISNAQTYATAAAASATAAAASAASISPTVGSAQSISAGGQVTLDADLVDELIRVVGNAGAVTTSTTPFSSTPAADKRVALIGTDNTNTVTISNNDAAGGCLLNGPTAILALNNVISFIYDATEDRYIELSRNF